MKRTTSANNKHVAGMTFIILNQQHSNFLGQLQRELKASAPRVSVGVGGIMNYLLERRILDDKAAVSTITGQFPANRCTISMDQAKKDTIYRLKVIAIPQNLKLIQECAVGIQESILMLGFDKVIGVAGDTLTASSKYIKLAKTTFDYTMKSSDYIQKSAAYYESLCKTKEPAKVMINSMF